MKLLTIKKQDQQVLISILGRNFVIKRKRKPFNNRVLTKEIEKIKYSLLDTQSHSGLMYIFSHQELIMDLCLEVIYHQNIRKPFSFTKHMKKVESVNVGCWTKTPGCIFANLPFLFKTNKYTITAEPDQQYADCYCLWGTQPYNGNLEVIKKARYDNHPLFILEGGFISNIEGWSYKSNITLYNSTISFLVDDLSPYYDARRENRLEQMLNDQNLILTSDQLLTARQSIKKIVENYITKYNHQPIYKPSIGRKNTKKILVVDQTYGDMSITKGYATEKTFISMLETAIKENPEADIIVKTHPDVVAGAKGYYTGIKQNGQIYPLTEAINPISLIQYVDKVYVCTSQLGFEAVMCGKEVHVFGMPFYAGWGLTIDYQRNIRRRNKRSLEEIFYITYIMYTHYISPITKDLCSLNEALDYIIDTRESYFNERKIRYEK